jgi:tRNA pseudouridine38-40 synthase
LRYFLEIAYHGRNYAGWQVQPHQLSVQQVIEDVLSQLYDTPIAITGAGRTDAGVHALQTFAHVDLPTSTNEQLVYKLNKMLPEDILIKGLRPVATEAHARYDALSRSYQYFVHVEKDPFLSETSYHFPYGIPDMELMALGADVLMRHQDFAPLSRKNPDLNNTLCQITEARWETIVPNKRLVFHITANRFLHNMVRRITGALLMIGTHKLSVEELEYALQNKESMRINVSLPPHGLYLTRVTYPY